MPAQRVEYELYVRDKATGELKKLDAAFKGIGQSGAAAGAKASEGMSQMEKSTKKAVDSATQLERTLGRLQRTIVAFAGVWMFREVTRGFTSLISTAIEYNKLLEQSRLGIAGVLAANLQSADKQLTATQALVRSQREALSIIRALREANLKTAATFPQLITMFQQALPHALQRGFNIRQVEQFVTAMSQAATSMGIPLNMMAEEMRAMLKGTISTKNTLIAVALNVDRTMARTLGGTELFNYLMSKLAAFKAMGDEVQQSFEGIYTNMKQALQDTLGAAFEQFFEDVKGGMTDLTDFFKSSAFKSDMKDIADNIRSIFLITKSFISLYKTIPDDWIKAGGAGIAMRVLFGSWKPSVVILLLTQLNNAFKYLNQRLKTDLFPTTNQMTKAVTELAEAIKNLYEVAAGTRRWTTGAQIVKLPMPKIPAPSVTRAIMYPLGKGALDQHELDQALSQYAARVDDVLDEIHKSEKKRFADRIAAAKAAYKADIQALETAREQAAKIDAQSVEDAKKAYADQLKFWEKEYQSMVDAQAAIDEHFTRQYLKEQDERQRAAEEAARKAQQAYQHMLERIQDETANIFYDMFSDIGHFWENLLNKMKDLFLRTLAEMAAQAVTKPIVIPIVQKVAGTFGINFPGVGGGGINISGIPGLSLLGGAGGGWSGATTPTLYGPSFASNIPGAASAAPGFGAALIQAAPFAAAGLAAFSLINKWASHSGSGYGSQYLSIQSSGQMPQTYGKYPYPTATVKSGFGTLLLRGSAYHAKYTPTQAEIDHIAAIIRNFDEYFAAHLDDAAKQALSHQKPMREALWWKVGDPKQMSKAIERFLSTEYSPFFEAINTYADDVAREIFKSSPKLDDAITQIGQFLTYADKIPEFWDKMAETIKETGESAYQAYQETVAFYQLTTQIARQQVQLGRGVLSPSDYLVKYKRYFAQKYGVANVGAITQGNVEWALKQLFAGNPEDVARTMKNLGLDFASFSQDLITLDDIFKQLSSTTEQTTKAVDAFTLAQQKQQEIMKERSSFAEQMLSSLAPYGPAQKFNYAWQFYQKHLIDRQELLQVAAETFGLQNWRYKQVWSQVMGPWSQKLFGLSPYHSEYFYTPRWTGGGYEPAYFGYDRGATPFQFREPRQIHMTFVNHGVVTTDDVEGWFAQMQVRLDRSNQRYVQIDYTQRGLLT